MTWQSKYQPDRVYEEIDFQDLGSNYQFNKNKFMQYKFSKGLLKGVVGVVIFGLPIVLANFPAYMDLTIGGAGLILVNYLKVKFFSL